MGQPFIDLTGQRFGKLTVIEFAGKDDSKYRYRQWKCVCDCGKTKVVTYRDLKRDQCKSCGCMMRAGLAKGGMNKRDYGEARFNDLFLSYKRSATNRGYIFKLTREEFRTLTKGDCYYCGQEPSQIVKAGHGVNGEYIYNGIDRIDNSIGYLSSNVRTCCKQCNIAKGVLTEDEFMTWAKRLVARFEHGETPIIK